MIDTFAVDMRSHLPIADLKKEDFRVRVDGKDVPIATFDNGRQYETRPVVV